MAIEEQQAVAFFEIPSETFKRVDTTCQMYVKLLSYTWLLQNKLG